MASRRWCSPLVGNPQSPTPAPLNDPLKHVNLWRLMLGVEELPEDITRLYKGMKLDPGTTLTRRAQVRIFDNIVEAARAVLSEVTTAPVRWLDKLFALKLTGSDRMLKRQRNLIDRYVLLRGKELNEAIQKKREIFTTKVCQYMAYYFGPAHCKTLNKGKLREALDGLITVALSDRVLTPSGVPEQVLTIWRRLPPVARCCVLINDLRNLVEDASAPTDARAALALKEELLLAEKPPKLWPTNYRVVSPKRKSFPQISGGTNAQFLAAWNPDEYAEYVMTYRMRISRSRHFVRSMEHASDGYCGGTEVRLTRLSRRGPRLGSQAPAVPRGARALSEVEAPAMPHSVEAPAR